MKLPESISIRDGRRCAIDRVLPSCADRYRAYQIGLAGESPYISTQVHEVKTVETLREQAQVYLDTPGHIWLAVLDESNGAQIADCMARITLREKMSHVATIGVGVRQHFRGQGLGRLLMERIIDWAVEDPTIHKLQLSMFAANTPAAALYQSLGFSIEGRRVRAFRHLDGAYDDEILMGKWLDETESTR